MPRIDLSRSKFTPAQIVFLLSANLFTIVAAALNG